jgi:hypothetical protein
MRILNLGNEEALRNDEARMTKETRSPNDEYPIGTSDFSHSFVIRHSSFVILLARTQDSGPGVFRFP